jgi:hypothetical protein
MKFELIEKKDFSEELAKIHSDRKKKDELKTLGFAFDADDKKNYWLESFPFEDFPIFSDKDEKIHITISNNGTFVATKEKNSALTQVEQKKIDAVVKKMYELLGIKENEYQSVKQTGFGAGSANAASIPLPTAKNYHSHLTAHANALNTALKPHSYQVNVTNNTLEKIGADGTPTGHKITVNEDGSTKGDLFSDFSNTETIAKSIAEDHIAVVNMHLALLKQGIKPDKKINLFLIEQGLSAEDKKKLPDIKEKIKALLAEELAKPEYNDIKEFIVYDGTPIEKKPAAKPEPSREKNFIQKITAGEDTGNMWLATQDIYHTAQYALIEKLCDFSRLSIKNLHGYVVFDEIADNSRDWFPKQPRPLYVCMNHSMTHHVLVYIDAEEKLNYINSMSGNIDSTKEMLRKKFPGFREYNVEHLGEQKDGWSCGYRVAREILKREGLHDHPLVKATTSQDIRNAFVETAKAYISRLPVTKSRLFEKPERYDYTQDGKMQYYEISETVNNALFDLIAKLDTTKLDEAIAGLCQSNEKFRHALINTAPHYIYYNNGEDAKLGVGKNGLGNNDMGIALMEARNELFLQKDPKHPLIVNDTKALLAAARKERGEVDNLVGAEETKGKSIREIMILVRKANKAKAEADATKSPRLGT